MDHPHWHFCWTICVSVLTMCGFLSAGTQQKKTLPTKSGETMTTQQTGFYCNLKALSPAEWVKHKKLTNKLDAARIGVKELPDGYAFELKSGSVTLSDLAEWISKESRCCPFFDFTMELQRDGGPLWLKLTGRDGIKPFIRSEFSF